MIDFIVNYFLHWWSLLVSVEFYFIPFVLLGFVIVTFLGLIAVIMIVVPTAGIGIMFVLLPILFPIWFFLIILEKNPLFSLPFLDDWFTKKFQKFVSYSTEREQTIYGNKDTMPFEEVETIVREFGLFIVKCKPPLAISFHDIETLPYPKDKIRDALIQGIRVTDNSEMLRSMRGALFTCLPCFQAQVGLTPISTSNFDAVEMLNQSSSLPTSDEMQAMATKFLEGNDVRNEKIPELQQLFEKDVSEYSQILDQ